MKIKKCNITIFCLCELAIILLLVGNLTFTDFLPHWGDFLFSTFLISIGIYTIWKFILLIVHTLNKQNELLLLSNKEHVEKLLNILENNKQETNGILSALGKLNEDYSRDIINTLKQHSELIILENSKTKDLLANIEKQNINMQKSLDSYSDILNNYSSTLIDNNKQLKNIEIQGQSIDRKIDIISQHSNDLKKEISIIDNSLNAINKINLSLEHHIKKTGENITQQIDEIKEQIISAQINQNNTKDEIKSFRIILDSIKKILEYNNIKDNKIETYEDERTGYIVENHYEKGVLKESIMKCQNGGIIYKLLYKEGNIEKSMQYNEDGKMSIEQIFFSNGEVHYRTEYTYQNGKEEKIVTEFDEMGNKIE